jgi:hypothetical protein
LLGTGALPDVEDVITVRNGIFYGFLIILFAALVTHTGRSGGGASTGGGTGGGGAATNSGRSLADALAGGAGVYCTILADPVRRDSAGKRVVAPGRYRCDRPGADTLTMTVALQKLGADGSTWTNVAVQQFSAKGASTTRDLTEAQRTREVSAPCAAGTYRTAVSATRTSQTTKQYATQSPSRTNPCGR